MQFWTHQLPLNIRMFLWELVSGHFPRASRLWSATNRVRAGAFYDVDEDSNHIFFTCVTALFLWSSIREVVGCRGCPTNFSELYEILWTSFGQWVGFNVLAWTLWTIHNKLVIEHISILWCPTDAINYICGFFATVAGPQQAAWLSRHQGSH